VLARAFPHAPAPLPSGVRWGVPAGRLVLHGAMASLFQQNSGVMHNPLLPGGDQATAAPFGFGPCGQQRASIPREPSTRTQQPIVTGTGVLGLKFKDGVMLASDTLGIAALCGLQRAWPRAMRRGGAVGAPCGMLRTAESGRRAWWQARMARSRDSGTSEGCRKSASTL
jgi:hypothetical protein